MNSRSSDSQDEARAEGSASLAGDDALLTAEWTLPDLPWLNAEDGVVALPDPPTPPSRRQSPPVKTNVPPDTIAMGGAVTSGANAPQRPPLVTHPKKPRFETSVPPRVVAPRAVSVDLAATLPPMAERLELPSVECGPAPAAGSWLGRIRQNRAAAAASTLACAAAAYVGASGLSHPQAVPPDRFPSFLRQSADAADAALQASTVHAAESGPTPPPPTAPQTVPEATGSSAVPGAQAAPAAGTEAPPGPVQGPATSLEPAAGVEASSAASEAPGRTTAPAAARTTDRKQALEQTPPALATAAPTASTRRVVAPALAGNAARSVPARPPAARLTTAERATNTPSTVPPAPPLRPLTTYTYGPTALYKVTTAPERVTDLALQPGESLTMQPTAGDAARWVVSVADTVLRDEPQQHVFIKPLRPGIVTNLTLTTNHRSYHLELSSATDGSYMAAVEWKYPLDDAERRRQELVRLEAERQSSTAVADLNALRFDYAIRVTSGSPSWKPVAAFDDGQKTFIRFPQPVSPTRAPLLFVLRAGDVQSASYINYRVKGDLYVLDRVIAAAELRFAADGDPSSKHQDVVRITRQ